MNETKTLPLAVILLMGGFASRMGQPKSELLLKGVPFGAKIAAALSAVAPVYLSCSADTLVSDWQKDYPVLTDEISHIGPMGGILSAMHQVDADVYFFCACDQPYMTAEFLQLLSNKWDSQLNEGLDALLVKGENGRIYTTAGLYGKRLLPKLSVCVAAGDYRLHRLLAGCKVAYIEEATLGPLSKSLVNINTPEEYKNLL